MGWGIETKLPVTSKRDLSLIYTPGVGECCIEISKNPKTAMELTNKSNSIAVFAFEDKKTLALEKAEVYRMQGFDAYPIIIAETKVSTLRVIESLHPTFGHFDINLLNEKIDSPQINQYIPKVPLSYKIPNVLTLPNNIKKASVVLHSATRGVIKQKWSYNEPKLIGVISNGSAVLGFGNIGPDAAMPVMEGKAALFKVFGDVDAIPVCIDAKNIDEFKEIIKALEPTFAGINLEDICAPDCFEVEESLKKDMTIPVFHDDQHGTAIVVLSGIINALKLINKTKENVKVVFSGAGAGAIAVAKLLLDYGIKNIILTDINGVIFKGRESNDKYLEEMAERTNLANQKGKLENVIVGADIFIGLSAKDILTEEMVKSMGEKPVIFALANPTPEIMPDKAQKAGAFIIATGRSDFPNQINNSLIFPGIFKGILQTNLKSINTDIKLKAAEALANKVKVPEKSAIIPDSMDLDVAEIISKTVIEYAK